MCWVAPIVGYNCGIDGPCPATPRHPSPFVARRAMFACQRRGIRARQKWLPGNPDATPARLAFNPHDAQATIVAAEVKPQFDSWRRFGDHRQTGIVDYSKVQRLRFRATNRSAVTDQSMFRSGLVGTAVIASNAKQSPSVEIAGLLRMLSGRPLSPVVPRNDGGRVPYPFNPVGQHHRRHWRNRLPGRQTLPARDRQGDLRDVACRSRSGNAAEKQAR